MHPVNERISEVLKVRGISKTAIAAHLNVTKQGLANYLKNKNSVNENLFNVLFTFIPDLNKTWLLSGEGNMFTQIDEKNIPIKEHKYSLSDIKPIDPSEWRYFPLIPEVASASFMESFSDPHNYRMVPVWNAQGKKYDKGYCQEVIGESMEPTIPDHSIVLLLPVSPEDWPYLSSGVFCVYMVNENMRTIKRIAKNELQTKGIIELSSDNNRHGNMDVRGENIRAISKVERIVDAAVR